MIGKHLRKNPTIALNILYIKGKEICPSFISKFNLTFQKQIILLMIPKISLKKLSNLLRGVISKHHRDFCCLNCLLSYTTKNKLMKKYVKIRILAEL